MNKQRLILVGPPGAGKGTQAVSLADSMNVPNLSTGAIFRENISAGTDLGKKAQEFIAAGNLVPDEVTDAMVRAQLSAGHTREGFLLDGYPRNTHQVQELDAILSDLGVAVDVVLELTIPDEDIVHRLLKRAEIEGRMDDTEDVIRHRIEVYHEQTQPIIDVYAQRGLLVKVDGSGSIEEIHERIINALQDFAHSSSASSC